MNANIVKIQIFQKIKYELRGHSWSQIMTFLITNFIFSSVCYLLIEETNAAEHYERTKFELYKDNICLVLTLTYVLKGQLFVLIFLLAINFKNVLSLIILEIQHIRKARILQSI